MIAMELEHLDLEFKSKVFAKYMIYTLDKCINHYYNVQICHFLFYFEHTPNFKKWFQIQGLLKAMMNDVLCYVIIGVFIVWLSFSHYIYSFACVSKMSMIFLVFVIFKGYLLFFYFKFIKFPFWTSFFIWKRCQKYTIFLLSKWLNFSIH